MYTQYKCLSQVNSLLFVDNSEPYLPSLITESDSQHATHSASSYKFRLREHNRSADEECLYYAAAKLWNNLHWIITRASRQPRPTSNYQFFYTYFHIFLINLVLLNFYHHANQF